MFKDLTRVGKTFQDIDGIVTDADHLDARSLNLLEVLLQLNQLPLAERSPVR